MIRKEEKKQSAKDILLGFGGLFKVNVMLIVSVVGPIEIISMY